MTRIKRTKTIIALAAAAVMATAAGTTLMITNKIRADAAIEAINSKTVGTLGELDNNYKDLIMPVDRIATKAVDSTQGGCEIDKMFDGDLGSKWEAVWNPAPPEVTFTFSFAQPETITGFYEVTRSDNNINGTMSTYKIETSTDGSDWQEVISDGTVPYRLGTWSSVFEEPITTQHLRIKTDARAITEFRFYYEPGEADDLSQLKTEVDSLIEYVQQGEEGDAYSNAVYEQIHSDKAAAESMPESTPEEIDAKAKAYLDVLKLIKRGITVDVLSQSNYAEVYDLYREAETYYNAAEVGEQPLYWTAEDKEAFGQIVEAAAAVFENGIAQQGDYLDVVSQLQIAYEDFQLAAIKPEVTQDEGFKFDDGLDDVNYLFDGLTESRWHLSNDASNFDGTKWVTFNYGNEINIDGVTVAAWRSGDQGIKKIKMQYWDGAEWQNMLNPDGTGDGVFTITAWSGNNVESSWVEIKMKSQAASQFRFSPIEGGPRHAVFDEFQLNIVVPEEDVSITILPQTAEVLEGSSVELSAQVLPHYLTNKNVIWESSDDSIATIDSDGVLKGISAGSEEFKQVTITATTEYGNKSASVTVTVKRKVIEEEDKKELRTLYEIEKKFANAQKQADYELAAFQNYQNQVKALQTEIDNANSLGQILDLENKLVTMRAELELNSKRTVQNVRDLIARITGDPADASRFDIELIPADETTGNDVWELGWNKAAGHPVLRGNNAVSLATAFNYYLKYYCYQDFPYVATATYDVNLPKDLPVVESTIRTVFPYKYRHYVNVNCEYKYTLVNYTEKEWQRRIDWMAMNGYNMFLFDFDYRIAWLEMARDGILGEAFDPASENYNPDAMHELLASSIDKVPMFGDYAVSEESVELAGELGTKVVHMAYDLGIEPEIRPFYGALPFMFPNNHDDYYGQAKTEFVIDLPNSVFDGETAYLAARWQNLPQGVAISPYTVESAQKNESEWTEDEKATWALFETLNDAYYEYYMECYGFNDYGRTVKYVYKDLVEEQGFVIKHAAYPNKMLSDIESWFQELNPSGRWIVSAWRVQEWEFDYFTPEHTLIIDLNGEKSGSTNEFWGTEWMHGRVYNFGGNNGIGYDLAAEVVTYAKLQANSSYLAGFSLNPEGSDTDPLFYDFMSELTWRQNLPTDRAQADEFVAEWMLNYAKRRYGMAAYNEAPELFEELMKLMQETYYAYSLNRAPIQSYINAKPRLSGAYARGTGTTSSGWNDRDASELFGICAALVNKVSPENMTKGFLYDMTDITRQVLAEIPTTIYPKIRSAYNADIELAKQYTQQIIDIIYDLDELLSSNENFLFGTRVQGARSRGATESDQAYFEIIERVFCTYWQADSEDNPGDTYDYSNKQLGGYLADWCGERWQMFYDQLDAASKASVKPSIDEFNRTYQPRANQNISDYVRKWTYESYNYWYNAQPDKSDLVAPFYPEENADYTVYSTEPVGDNVEILINLYKKYAPIMTEVYGKNNQADKSALQAIYDTASSMEKGEDTGDALWQEFLTARDYAKSVLDNANAEIGEVRVAEYALRNAIESISSGSSDILDLQAKYASYSALDTSIYTDESVSVLTAALAQAKTVLDSESPESEDITAAIAALDSAYEGLVVDVQKGLAKLKTETDRLSLIAPDGYTYASYKALTDAIKAAEEVLSSGTATSEQILEALNALARAESGLEYTPVLDVDKSDLQTIYDMCGMLTERFYTAESWNALQTAYNEAKAILDNADATQAQATAAYNALLDAYNGLTLAEEYTALPTEGGLNGGEIAGIVIGCVAAVAIIGVTVFLVCRRKKAGSKEEK